MTFTAIGTEVIFPNICNVSEYCLSLQQKTAGFMNTASDYSSEGKGS